VSAIYAYVPSGEKVMPVDQQRRRHEHTIGFVESICYYTNKACVVVESIYLVGQDGRRSKIL
jgi:hypothetical protein